MRRPTHVRALRLVLAGAVLAVVAACAASPDGVVPSATPSPTATAGAAPAPATAECDDPTTSYAPDAGLTVAAGSTMARIKERGSLVVGVSSDTLLMGARDPIGGSIEGFDIDLLREVSRALFGTPDRLQFRVITSAQRIDVLKAGEVDLVARAFTMNCDRWTQIAFSAEYLHAGQKVLVTRDSEATGMADLDGKRVCAPAGTTTLERLTQYTGVEAVPADTHTGCLVLFQQGKVDAITGDDTILAGFAAQDPYAKVVGDAISDEPYGIGVNAQQVDLVRYVNAVLDQAKDDGTWATLYAKWLGALGPAPTPPVSVYGRVPGTGA